MAEAFSLLEHTGTIDGTHVFQETGVFIPLVLMHESDGRWSGIVLHHDTLWVLTSDWIMAVLPRCDIMMLGQIGVGKCFGPGQRMAK